MAARMNTLGLAKPPSIAARCMRTISDSSIRNPRQTVFPFGFGLHSP
jgi:hypothetical protein